MDSSVGLIAIVPVVVSPLAVQLIRLLLEDGKPRIGYSLKTDSWAYLLGDMAVLPVSLGVATYASQDTDWLFHWFWVTVSILVALCLTLAYRAVASDFYAQAGDQDRLYSPTKMWHDYVAFMVVGSLLCWTGIPAIMTGTVAGWAALGALFVRLALVICDRIRGLDPKAMYPRVQDTAFERLFR